MGKNWVVDARFEDLRQVMAGLIASKRFTPPLHSVAFAGENVVRAILEVGDDYRETLFYMVPGKGELTRIETVNRPETDSEPIAWSLMFAELRILGYTVRPLGSDLEPLREQDPWLDLEDLPENTPELHRKIIRVLKENFHSKVVRKDKYLAEDINVSTGLFSTVRNKPEYRRRKW